MKLVKNLKKITLIFFFVIGTVYIFSWLMAVNNYFVNTTRLLNKILELPFIFTALVYGFLNLKESFSKSTKKHKLIDIIFIILLIIVFSIVLYINFFIPAR